MNIEVPEGTKASASEARWPKVVAGLIVVVFISAVVIEVVVGPRLPSEYEDSVAEDLGLMLAFGAFALTGALLVAKRPRNVVSWMVAAVGLMPSVFQPLDTYGAWVVSSGRPVNPLVVFGFWGQEWYWLLLLTLVAIFVPLYFPDGRLPSPRWRPWALVPVLGVAFIVLAGMTQPTIGSNFLEDAEVDNPIGIAWVPEAEGGLADFALLFGILLAVAAIVVRFRRSRGVERQQLKVFLFAVSLLPVLPLGDVVPLLDGGVVFPLIIAALPVAIAVAVLRYRLYGIDRIVSRTVSYALLTALLVGVYALGVLGIGALLPGEPSDLLVAGSTLVVAALFQPLRSRIQGIVDRRFNRAGYDAVRTVEAFAAHLRDEVDADALQRELREVIGSTFGSSHVGTWVPGGVGT